MDQTSQVSNKFSFAIKRQNIGMLTLGYSNIVKLLDEISGLKHAKYTKIVTSKCETVI